VIVHQQEAEIVVLLEEEVSVEEVQAMVNHQKVEAIAEAVVVKEAAAEVDSPEEINLTVLHQELQVHPVEEKVVLQNVAHLVVAEENSAQIATNN